MFAFAPAHVPAADARSDVADRGPILAITAALWMPIPPPSAVRTAALADAHLRATVVRALAGVAMT
jgi:hypothetical protein